MEETAYPFVRRSSLLAQARMHPRVTAGGLLGVFLIAAGVVAAQRLIGREAQPATGFRAWRERAEGWADQLGDRVRDLDLRGRFRDLDVPARADRVGRYAKDHAAEGMGALAAVAAVVGAVALAWNERDRFR